MQLITEHELINRLMPIVNSLMHAINRKSDKIADTRLSYWVQHVEVIKPWFMIILLRLHGCKFTFKCALYLRLRLRLLLPHEAVEYVYRKEC